MSESKVKLSEASGPQLRAFAELQLGITFPGNASKEVMRAKIAAAWNKDEIPVADPVDTATQQGAPPPPATASQKPPEDKKVRILVQRTEDAGGDEAVPVGVSGKVMLIPRGKEVDVPESYFEVLKNAIRHVYDPLPDGKGINPVPREVPMYPFQRIA